MRIKDIIVENASGSLTDAVSNAMPATFVMPGLKNQDPYLQYRFGLALASARARAAGEVPYEDESTFGENLVVVARSKEEEEQLSMALALFGKDNSKRQIANTESSESSDTYHQSPVVQNSGRRKQPK